METIKSNQNCPECGSILSYQVVKNKPVAEVCPECDYVLQLYHDSVTLDQLISTLSPISQQILRG